MSSAKSPPSNKGELARVEAASNDGDQGNQTGAVEAGTVEAGTVDPLAQAGAAGLTGDDLLAAHMAAEPAEADAVANLQRRVARLEIILFGDLNAHFGGKIPALAAPPSLGDDDTTD